MRAYYNEFDKKAAAWLRELIKAGLIMEGDVDERSITDVRPDDLVGYTRVHFFAGIGGWDYALRLAGWPEDRPVWTGSCPCQPFSRASHGKGKRLDCEKHLWPHFFRLITGAQPSVVFGEQVASALDWMDQVIIDLELGGYTVEAEIIPAYVAGADHERERIYFAGYANNESKPIMPINAKVAMLPWSDRESFRVVQENGIPAGVAYRAFGNAIVPQVAAAFIEAYTSADNPATV